MAAMSPVGPGLPMGQAPGGMPPMDMQGMIFAMLEQVMQKWGGQQAQLAGEQGTLAETLSMIMEGGAVMPQEAFAEGIPGNMGMSTGQLPEPGSEY